MTRLKLSIIIGGITSLFFLFGAGYVTKDILTPFSKLNHDSSTIRKIVLTYHSDKTHSVPQYDIYLADKPYFIRISDDYRPYWNIISNNKNIDKEINYYYLAHVKSGTILHNPSQLSIDGKIIYAYGTDLSSGKFLVGLFILFFLLLGTLTCFAIKAFLRKSKSGDIQYN